MLRDFRAIGEQPVENARFDLVVSGPLNFNLQSDENISLLAPFSIYRLIFECQDKF